MPVSLYYPHFRSPRKVTIVATSRTRDALERELPPYLVELHDQGRVCEADSGESIEQTTSSTNSLRQRSRNGCAAKRGRLLSSTPKPPSTVEAALSTAMTTSLETEYRSLYESITSNPEIVPVLRKATGTEDLHLQLETFFGLKNLSAPSLLQESYRNALAISIFLSAAVRARPVSRFIVLDDVTSSFDAGHQFALMELLRTRIAHPANPDGPQIIILSHDGLLEKYFDVKAGRGDGVISGCKVCRHEAWLRLKGK